MCFSAFSLLRLALFSACMASKGPTMADRIIRIQYHGTALASREILYHRPPAAAPAAFEYSVPCRPGSSSHPVRRMITGAARLYPPDPPAAEQKTMGNLISLNSAAGCRCSVRIYNLKFCLCLAVRKLIHTDPSFFLLLYYQGYASPV